MATEADLEESEQEESLTLLTHQSMIPCMLLLLLPKPCSDWLEARKKNITKTKCLNAEASHLNAKVGAQWEQCKASWPQPRCVLLQPKDLGAGGSGQKTKVLY